MKKITVILSALVVLVVTTTAMATFQVEVKTNSEPVTGAACICEKAGSVTLIFDNGTTFRDGDWITTDLPVGVTICKGFDFVVIGAAGGGGGIVPGPGGFPVGTTPLVPVDDGSTENNDVWAVQDLVAADGNAGSITVTGSPMFFRVRGTTGTGRIRIGVYDSDTSGPGSSIDDPLNYDASSTMTVDSGSAFQIRLFDSQPHDGTGLSGGIWALNDIPIGGNAPDGRYGNAGMPDLLQQINDWDNAYCIRIDSRDFNGSTVNMGINSGSISGSNFLTFNPSNPQVAHLYGPTNPWGNDADRDGVCDDVDNCPDVANSGQEDANEDGIGDACDRGPDDPDNDGLDYEEESNKKTNPNEYDTDGDGLNDGEDAYPLDPDADKNGIIDQ